MPYVPPGRSGPAVTDSATTYVTTDGNDAHDGLTWQTAKATIQAAADALPLAADGYSKNGTVEIGAGTFHVSSSTAVHSNVVFTAGSAVVTDASASAADIGGLAGGNAYAPAGARIVAVNPGVSFTMDRPAVGSHTYSAFTIYLPGVALYPGVRLRGRARFNGLQSGNSTNYPTQIVDAGTSHTIMAPYGSGPGSTGSSVSLVGCRLEDLCVIGNAGNDSGFACADIWGVTISGCEFQSHGQWGIRIGANANVHLRIVDVDCRNNGTAAAAVATGGIRLDNSPSIGTLINVRAIKNYGFGIYTATGIVLIGCEPQYTSATSFSGSGVGVMVTDGAPGNGTVQFIQCWFEANAAYQLTFFGSSAPKTLFLGCMFQGGTTTPYAIGLGDSTSPIVLDGCYYQGHTTASLKDTQSAAPGPVTWRQCESTDPLFAKSFSGSANDLPTTVAPFEGRRGVGQMMGGLPTADPHLVGQLWSNAGVLTVSAG